MKRTIFIERQCSQDSSQPLHWKVIPNGSKIEVLETMLVVLDVRDGHTGSARHMFRIHHLNGIARGDRVTYLGVMFRILHVSDSPKLMGLELTCERYEAASTNAPSDIKVA